MLKTWFLLTMVLGLMGAKMNEESASGTDSALGEMQDNTFNI